MIRTRFAPSPTGYLHIGGVRTALFNWLYARKHGGRFVLRIDDTDRERNVEQALAPILAGFRWLGIDWDEGPEVGGEYGPYYQSERLERYQAAARTLVEHGLAYHDYATPEELNEEREAAQRDKTRFIYSRRFMAETPEECARLQGQGRRGVVRLKMPREGSCRFTDLVRGGMELEWAREQDHVIQRADGSCLYHLASVVDDHAMAISHVVRAEEHLSNTPRQIFIAEGLGYRPPVFAHLPVVAEPGSRNKLSKRKIARYMKQSEFARLNEHGERIVAALGLETSEETFNPVVVDFYREIGFLPDALVNYLLLLGWSLDDRSEMFTRDEMIGSFGLERVNRAPASFDPAKLIAFQERYMLALSPAERLELCLPFAEQGGLVGRPATDEERTRLSRVIEAAGDRIKLAGDVLSYGELFAPDDELAYDEKAFDKRLRRPGEAAELLRCYGVLLKRVEPFDVATLERETAKFIESEGIKPGQIVHAVRVAVTGKPVGFGLYDALAILGRESSVARIERALARIC